MSLRMVQSGSVEYMSTQITLLIFFSLCWNRKTSTFYFPANLCIYSFRLLLKIFLSLCENNIANCVLLFQEVVLSPTSTSYNMGQLSASTEYIVRLQAISGPMRSRIISTVFTTSESTYANVLLHLMHLMANGLDLPITKNSGGHPGTTQLHNS